MLKIRRDQVHTLSCDEDYQSFVIDMIEHLRRFFGKELADTSNLALAEDIQACLERARGYGLRSRRDNARFLGLLASHGWNFDTESRWARDILRATAAGPSERLTRVFDRCVDELQQEADTAARRQRLGI